jgi:hypothetical protein
MKKMMGGAKGLMGKGMPDLGDLGNMGGMGDMSALGAAGGEMPAGADELLTGMNKDDRKKEKAKRKALKAKRKRGRK